MIIIHVDYTEGDPDSYKGIVLIDGETDTEVARFNSGLGKWKFLTDWTRTVVWAKKHLPDKLFASSSLHDYAVLMDVVLNI